MQDGSGKTSQGASEASVMGCRRAILHIMGVLLAAGLASAVGLIGGSSFGGNFAPDFLFLGMPGYEGSGLLGAVTAGSTVFLVGSLAAGLLKRSGSLVSVLIGALAAIALGQRLLFPLISPDELAFALLHVGCAFGGALIGWGIATLTTTQREEP